MSDLISRKATIDQLLKLDVSHRVSWKDAVIDEIDALPSAQPDTNRPTGTWVLSDYQREEDTQNDNYLYECSNCGHADVQSKSTRVPYCWYCGAKMEVNNERFN